MTVLLAPLIVTVLVPFVNVLVAPLVSQFPATLIEPDVSEIVDALPLVIVTSPTVIDEVVAVSVPLTVSADPPVMALPDVTRTPPPPWTRRAWLTSMALLCVTVDPAVIVRS